MKLNRTNSRTYTSNREINVIPDFCPNSMGSVLFSTGNTRVICAATVSDDVPPYAESDGMGWLTAEYTMLPYSTFTRKKREFKKRDGRSVEIQRLIGRSLRAGIDLSKISGYSITVDCDVLQADGGTRTASITGGFLAMKMAVEKMLNDGMISENPLLPNVAAVSVGIVEGELLLDLDYKEDSRADVDMNVVMNSEGKLIEVQGTGESAVFSIEELNSMIELAGSGINKLIEVQNSY